MREQLENLNYQQLLKVSREYNKIVSVPIPAGVTKKDLIDYILKHAKDIGTLLKIMSSVRSGELDKEKGDAKGRGRPKKKTATETQTETKKTKPKLKVVGSVSTPRLESEMRSLEMYKKRFEMNPSTALASIIKRQEERVKMAS
jgi:hypothetical protein